MKQLVCEMCGSTEMLKQDGVFVCQTCGTKYSVEEAKKMIVEIDGPVSVVVNKEKQTINALKLADDNFNSANYEQAQTYYTMVLEEEYNNAYATYMVGLCRAWQSTLAHLNSQALIQAMINAKKAMLSENMSVEEIDEFCIFMLIKTNDFYLAFRSLAIEHYNKFNTLKDSAIDYYNHQTSLLLLQKTAIDLLDDSCLQNIKNEKNIQTAINNSLSSVSEICKKLSYIDGVEQNGRDIYGNPMYQDKYYSIRATADQVNFANKCQAFFKQILNNLPTEVKRKKESQDFFAEKKQLENNIKRTLYKKRSEMDKIDPEKVSGLSIFLGVLTFIGPFMAGGACETLGIDISILVGVLVFIVMAAIVTAVSNDNQKRKREQVDALAQDVNKLEKMLKEPNKYKKEIEKFEKDFNNSVI